MRPCQKCAPRPGGSGSCRVPGLSSEGVVKMSQRGTGEHLQNDTF